RDSTPVYSALWRIFFQWFGHEGEGWMPNALAATAPEMTVRSYLDLFNIKANHRKTLTTEKGTLISSANPHDASAFFANVAIEVKDTALVNDVLKTEQAAASLSEDIRFPKAVERENEQKDAYAQLLTEGAIQEEVISEIESTEKGDEIWLAMFYLADRNVVRGLTDAANRGVEVRMVLDTNKHSFGKKKTGLPNVSTTDELREDTNGRIKVRWYAPAPEQFHPKMMYIKHKNYSTIIGGSANFTSRNLNDFNLETDIKLTVKNESEIAAAIDHYYRMIWNNQGAVYTVEYNEQDTSIAPLQRGIYAIQKLLHLTTY
ncbi:MAG TPA: phospholipase D-like domain-containing protein, partial [Chondromyces sp.]|nr:phospholipase D-like domain-containing protein [Chondromyces sp.]